MLDGIESANEGRLLRILEAFLTPSYVARLRTILSDQVKNDESYLKNLRLLTSSMHKAFQRGHVAMKLKPYRGVKRVEEREMLSNDIHKLSSYGLYRLFPKDWYGLFLGDGTEWEYNILFTQKFTPDMKRLPLPSCHLFEIHSRFATALYQFFVIDKISKGWLKDRCLGLLSDFSFPPIRRLFIAYGCVYRLQYVYCCHYLVRFGRWLYGPTGAVSVARAPFRLYIEQTTRSGINEPNALKLIE
ncbi:uncharacterized protein EAF02_005280 [Botrytis sinoallii]|uniref:uncharacterized protein n=1 Tax=Botrytis sinoallii TaxID=1463999 RepID=UPI0018FF56D1|nr:uncharacterized protein EAF02_005280 [Botrytis sinoallii]KAF7883360.1 hypothetical protein EAF02_005280 [Botrytis sinoallii]